MSEYETIIPMPWEDPIVDYYPLTRGEVVATLVTYSHMCSLAVPIEVQQISNAAEKILTDNDGQGVRVKARLVDVEILPVQDAFVIRVWSGERKCTVGAFLYGCNKVDLSLYKYGNGREIIKSKCNSKRQALLFGGLAASCLYDMRVPRADGSLS